MSELKFAYFNYIEPYIGRQMVMEHDLITSDQQLIESARLLRGQQQSQSRTSSFEIENLLKTAEQVTTYCRSPQGTRKSSPTGSITSSASNAHLTPSRHLSDAEKLRKVILELVDTEKAYVKVRAIHEIILLILFMTNISPPLLTPTRRL